MMPQTLRYSRRNLPHWIVADRTYFVTLRLDGTLPRGVIKELQSELAGLRAMSASEDVLHDAQRRHFVKVEHILDACKPNRAWLTHPGVASILVANLAWLESPEIGWAIYAAVNMSNHMHLLMRNHVGRTGHILADLAAYKRYTARQANRLLQRKGAFWAREDFDHWCRTPEKVLGAVQYIKQNPVKAGLVTQWQEWPWTVVKDGV